MKAGMARYALIMFGALIVFGCVGVRTFPVAARPGDMILIPVGWNTHLRRDNTAVTITPSSGSLIRFGPNDPNIRAVVNLYPDPVSKLLIGMETNQDMGVNAQVHGSAIQQSITGANKDWSNTVVYLRLPATLPAGIATIDVADSEGDLTGQPIQLEIISSSGSTIGLDPFNSTDIDQQLAALERADHFAISFSGSIIPHSVQIDFSHATGVGKPWVINPRSDIKNLAWSDDGSKLRVLLTPTHGETLDDLSLFDFYIAGNITELQLVTLKAFDVSGNPITGISADVE